jgi:hypothetical protein
MPSDAEIGRNMAKISDAERLARAVLMFFGQGRWTAWNAEIWLALTGKEEATTKVLGDLAREILIKEERANPTVPRKELF